MSTPTHCLDCKWKLGKNPAMKHCGRGLCRICYGYHQRHGTLDKFPRLTHSLDERASDVNLLLSQGYSRKQIADRLGVSVGCVRKTIHRSRAA